MTTAKGSEVDKNPERFLRSRPLRETCNRVDMVVMVLLLSVLVEVVYLLFVVGAFL